LQKQLKSAVKEIFEFRSNRNRTRVITRGIADFQSDKSHFDANNLSYYSFYPKSKKGIKAVIRNLPHNTPAEDKSDGLVSRGFDVISVKQMTATRWSPTGGSTTINLPLYLITLPSMAKSQEMFRLESLCHMAIRVGAYRAYIGLTQCHNCQQFGHVWANCKQPSRCLWCETGSPAQGVSRERKYVFHPNMLQLSVGGSRKTLFRKLSGMQTRKGGDAQEEVEEDT
jgi:hypothetical protein